MLGYEVILRDGRGKVLMAASRKEAEVNDSMEIELLAILRGLQLCVPMGLHDLVVEVTHSLLLIND